MLNLALRRLAMAVPTLLCISLVIFLLLEAAPGDPLGEMPLTVPPEVKERMRAALGVGEPWPLRYLLFLKQFFWVEPLHWLDRLLGTDFGAGQQRLISYQSRAPVFDVIAERLPQTLAVVGLSYLLGVLVALPVAILSARHPQGWFDRIAGSLAMLGYSLPTFLTGLVLIWVLAIWLKWLPSVYDTTLRVTDWASLLRQLRQMAMPVAVLTLYNAAQISRYLRAAMLDNLRQDHVRTARAKGLGEGAVLCRHVLRNSLSPVVTVIALGLPTVFGGAIITEQLFKVNGLGQLLILAINAHDLPMVMALTFVFALLIVLCTLLADLLYGMLDPRIRHG
jgi:peptide/nickel transport system permease protein